MKKSQQRLKDDAFTQKECTEEVTQSSVSFGPGCNSIVEIPKE